MCQELNYGAAVREESVQYHLGTVSILRDRVGTDAFVRPSRAKLGSRCEVSIIPAIAPEELVIGYRRFEAMPGLE